MIEKKSISKELKIYALCTVETGVNTLQLLIKHINIDGIIGLERLKTTDQISGFTDVRPLAEKIGCEFYSIRSYNLLDAKDKNLLLSLNIDILLVCGWQRLIPQWLVEHCRVGAIGGHGSAWGISAGRGRSPQNWAIMLGASSFEISIFYIDSGIDSGPVISTQKFKLTDRDDISSSYAKVSCSIAEMFVNAVKNGSIKRREATPQTGPVSYLPQRKPEDGGIDWNGTTAEIDRFIRALTKPYPGAFSELLGVTIYIWRARPFETNDAFLNEDPGKVIMEFSNGGILVATGNGAILIDEYSTLPSEKLPTSFVGGKFTSVDFLEQMHKIINRHQKKYPKLEISPEILRAANFPVP